ncbi:hypothetical protein [Paracidovorax valerianellae]|uniref:hypothetical protein n=1 Tax=Paracidovorax valerianellae TaxID=187868 RepID=UPI0011141AD5|nr:hypothetical protein [Paracidovorax valerianellae]MDA8444375.1 hypothetical protein [Paracidovorax valerianellae]
MRLFRREVPPSPARPGPDLGGAPVPVRLAAGRPGADAARCGPAAGNGGRDHSGDRGVDGGAERGAEREPGGEPGWYAGDDPAGRAPAAGLPR